MKAAFDAIDRDAARTTIKLTKSTARMFLAIETRWRLNLLWKGLEVMEPDEALAVLERAWHLPSYQTFSRRIDIRGARLAFRWVRFVDSCARCEETVVASESVSPWIRLSRVAAMAVYLAAARHSRLCALACPDEAETYKARARYWLAMAGVARRAEGRQLP
jgi:hypothetical protein